MQAVYIIFKVLAFATSLYMILCLARVFMSWFPGLAPSGATRFIEGATDPFLDVFRRVKFLRAGGVDFSPIAAFAVLSALSSVLNMASYGGLTLGRVLSLVIEVIWAPLAFLLSFFAILTLARIIAYWARWNSLHPLWRAIDAMVNPILFRVKRLVYRDRIVNYMQGLITGFIVLAGSRALLGLGVKALMALLAGF